MLGNNPGSNPESKYRDAGIELSLKHFQLVFVGDDDTIEKQNIENSEKAEEVPKHIDDVIKLSPDDIVVDLNHGRIGKIENLEPLFQLERLVKQN